MNHPFIVSMNRGSWLSFNNRGIKQMEKISIEPANDGFSSFVRCVSGVHALLDRLISPLSHLTLPTN